MTKKQAQLLAFIKSSLAEKHGVAPSFEEMKDAMGLKSKSGVYRLVEALVERGLIFRLPNRARALEILSDPKLSAFSTFALAHELERRGFKVEAQR